MKGGHARTQASNWRSTSERMRAAVAPSERGGKADGIQPEVPDQGAEPGALSNVHHEVCIIPLPHTQLIGFQISVICLAFEL
jgi:hypothetical protein